MPGGGEKFIAISIGLVLWTCARAIFQSKMILHKVNGMRESRAPPAPGHFISADHSPRVRAPFHPRFDHTFAPTDGAGGDFDWGGELACTHISIDRRAAQSGEAFDFGAADKAVNLHLKTPFFEIACIHFARRSFRNRLGFVQILPVRNASYRAMTGRRKSR